MFSKVKLSGIANSSLNLAKTMFYVYSWPRAVLFVGSFKSRALSRDPSGDRVMPGAEVPVTAQASYGNIMF